MNNNVGKIITTALQLLEEVGPMTAADLHDLMPEHKRANLNFTIKRLRTPSLTMPKRVYIKEYQREHCDQRRYPRAVYALGNKPDAKYPGPEERKVKVQRYRAKLGKTTNLMQASSIFRLGLNPNQIHADIRRSA